MININLVLASSDFRTRVYKAARVAYGLRD